MFLYLFLMFRFRRLVSTLGYLSSNLAELLASVLRLERS
jgi:hypothetical protein